MRKPRILTWWSTRPRNSSAPSGAEAGQVAGAVEPRAGLAGERVGHEALGGQLRPAEVAAGEAGAADAQLARHAGRHRLQGAVEQEDRGAGERPADRQRGGRGIRPGRRCQAGHRHRGLGRAVEVEQPRRRAGRGARATSSAGTASPPVSTHAAGCGRRRGRAPGPAPPASSGGERAGWVIAVLLRIEPRPGPPGRAASPGPASTTAAPPAQRARRSRRPRRRS